MRVLGWGCVAGKGVTGQNKGIMKKVSSSGRQKCLLETQLSSGRRMMKPRSELNRRCWPAMGIQCCNCRMRAGGQVIGSAYSGRLQAAG